MSSLKHVYLGMGDGVACWGTLLGGSGFKSRPKYDLFLTPCTSADVPWKKVDTSLRDPQLVRTRSEGMNSYEHKIERIPTLPMLGRRAPGSII
mgnify:CR=1 FL=1